MQSFFMPFEEFAETAVRHFTFTQNPLNCPTNNHNMQAIRSIYTVENGKLVIELPASFQHTEVEVIILPVSVEEEYCQMPMAEFK